MINADQDGCITVSYSYKKGTLPSLTMESVNYRGSTFVVALKRYRRSLLMCVIGIGTSALTKKMRATISLDGLMFKNRESTCGVISATRMSSVVYRKIYAGMKNSKGLYYGLRLGEFSRVHAKSVAWKEEGRQMTYKVTAHIKLEYGVV